jgi:hypothetical protein
MSEINHFKKFILYSDDVVHVKIIYLKDLVSHLCRVKDNSLTMGTW